MIREHLIGILIVILIVILQIICYIDGHACCMTLSTQWSMSLWSANKNFKQKDTTLN